DFHVTGVQTCALPIFAPSLLRGASEPPRRCTPAGSPSAGCLGEAGWWGWLVGLAGWGSGAERPRMAGWWPNQTVSGPRFTFQYRSEERRVGTEGIVWR